MTATVKVIPPHILGKRQIYEFASAVKAGGEVDSDSLAARVLQAAWLAIISVDGKPVGVGALKLPTKHHREELSACSGVDVSEGEYKYELGWIMIDPRCRGQKLSRELVAALLAKAGTAGVFCTVRVDNLAVQTACKGFGFIETGDRWTGNRGLLGLGAWKP